ncbi:uncharacterized protein LOC132103606 [Carassius carassius]|uniref:uncharacterized protein LOC132103606 n=1 Tax=Carassius carassius TaxID=217509 RepID=UPI002868D5F0|nr:uncharacterized protein LOC132103606 [Carassius carassius]XP_059364691.1 uncharacterized protein LOC132103606 [Carassius carassius]
MMLCWILISLFVGFLKAQEVIYAQVGGTVTLPREEIKAENVYVNWYRGNNESITIARNPQSGIIRGKDTKTNIDLSQDFSLKISPVQESDFEIWRCEQHVLTSTFKKTYKLYHVTIPKVPAVIIGESLSLECQMEYNLVKPKVTWIPPENTHCYQRNLKGEKIVVNSVSKCHSGVWTCKLEYMKKTYYTEATTTVYVIDLPSSQDPIYKSSSKVLIPCSLSSNIPWSILNETGLINGIWSFTPLSDPKSTHSLLSLSIGSVVRWNVIQDTVSPVKAKEIEFKDNDLSIHLPVSENIRGVYTCDLIFSRKTLSTKVQVEVLKGK